MANRINVVLSLDPSGFARAMNRVTRDLDRFASRVEGIGRDLTTRLTLPLAGVGVAAVRAFADLDKLERGLAAVSGSAEEGERQMTSLLDVVKDTRTTLDLRNAAKVSLQLQGVGQSAQDAERLLRQLGIAATATGQTADDVAEVGRQLSQSLAKGKLFQQELNILFDRLPALGAIVKQEFGAVTAEGLRNAGVSAQEFVSRLTRAAEESEAFARIQGGLAKEIETFGINAQIAAARLGEAISEAIDLPGLLNKISTFLANVSDGFNNLSDRTKRFIVIAAGIAAAIGPALLSLGAITKLIPLLVSGFTALVGTGKALVALALNPVVLAVAALAAGFIYLYNTSEQFRGGVVGTIRVLGELLRIAASAIKLLPLLAQAVANPLNAGASIEAFKAAFVTLEGDLGGISERLGTAFTEGFRDGITSKLKPKEILSSITNAILPAPINVSSSGFEETKKTTGTGIFKDAEKEADEYFRQKLPALAESGIARIIAAEDERRKKNAEVLLSYQTTSEGIIAAVQEIVPYQLTQLDNLEQIKESAAGIQERFQSLASAIAGPLQEAFSGFFDTILSGGENAFKAFLDVIKKVVAQLIKAVATALVLSAVFSIFSGGAGAAKGLLGIGSGTSLFGGLLKNLLPFAGGGLVTGPTAALIGEGIGTTRANPEVVAPLDKLKNMLSDITPGGAFVAEARLSGDDLLILVERAQRNRTR